ncbi:MAG: Molybdenum cofactor guanylyltransferase [Syntrophus sp. SKADARSKE-3]|nr:Molybdenum cofactor guanylyltransferase [Syntrophus sp. SKADARSKE-3]
MEKNTNGIAALILAAGTSSRMGTLKPLMSIGKETLIERAARLFREAGITEIVAVLGHEAERIMPALVQSGVCPVINADYSDGMFSSVQTGVRAFPPYCRAFFLLPVDMPLVRSETIGLLLESFTLASLPALNLEKAEVKGEGGGKYGLVCRPCYQDRRGHPPLISTALIPDILAFDKPGGLRAVIAFHCRRIVDVLCDDPGILIDIDTPDDYERHIRSLSRQV